MTDQQTQARKPLVFLVWALLVAFPLVVVGLWIFTNILFEKRIQALETQVEQNVQTLTDGQADRYTAHDAERDLGEIRSRLEKLENGV